MRILIDGRILGYFGPGEYLKNLLINLARIDRENKYIVIVNKRQLFKRDNFYFYKVPSFVKPYSLWEQALMPYLIKRFKPDIAYFPNFNIPLVKLCPYVVTIHDLIYLLYPEDSPSYLSLCYARFMLKKAARLADAIITDSECSQKDIVLHLNAPEEKVSAIPAAAARRFKECDKSSAKEYVRDKYDIKKDFLFYTGNHHYHKNLLTLIDAYSRLKERHLYNLVIGGERSWRTKRLEEEVKNRNLSGEVIFTGFIRENDLPILYNAAAAFVFPSIYEGFGLPPLEAMACGVPVIASDRGSLPEVLGDAAIFIDPFKSDELKDAMGKVLKTPSLCKELREKGLLRAGDFSWISTSERVLKVFEETATIRGQIRKLSRPLSVCFISNEYPPETGWGGIGTYTYNMAQGMARLGHSVHVVSRAVDKEAEYLDDQVHIYRIFNKKLRFPVLPRFFPLTYERLSRSFAVYQKVKELDERYNLDIVEAPDWGAEGLLWSMRRTLITKVHTPLHIAYRLNGSRFTLDSRISSFLEKMQAAKSRGINADSFSLARKIERLWGIKDVRVTYCPIDKTNSIPQSHKNIIGEDYILYFGQLSQRKGVSILAMAIGKVFEKCPDVKLVLDGQDMPYKGTSMRQYLLNINSQYRNRLIFLHTRSREELFSIIKNARVVVLPSLWEGFGYTCLEALSLGKLVIATRGSGFEEIILEDGVNGFLISPGDAEELSDKIIECLNNGYPEVEENARQRAMFFRDENICPEMAQYYMGKIYRAD